MTHKSIHDRVKDIESSLPELIKIVNQQFSRALEPLVQKLEAMEELLGKDLVKNKALELDMTQKKAALEMLVAEGRLEKTDVITDKSLVVGKEIVGGTPVHPGRFQLSFSEIQPKFQEQLLGKGPGTTLEIPEYGLFQVDEVYREVKK